MIDLEELAKQYHIVKAKGVRKDLKNIDTLRKLDEDIETGVTALVDDDAGAIVAFLLARGDFTEEEAKAWVKKVEEEGVNLSLRAGYAVQERPSILEQISAGLFSLLHLLPQSAIAASVDDLDFDTIRYLLTRAIEQSSDDEVTRWDDYRWVVDVFTEYVIIEKGGDLYKVSYTIDETNKVTLGDFTKVRKQYVPLAEAASLGTSAAPPEPHPGNEFIMHLRDVPQGFSAEADDEGRELIWKEIFRVSTTFRPGTGEALVIEQQMVDDLYASWEARVLDFVPITATTHYHEYSGMVPARDTDGELAKVVQQKGSLYGGLWIPDEALRRKILDDKTIRDVSIYAMPDFFDRRTGQRWSWVMLHLLLTNYPQVVGMEPFGVEPTPIAASLDADFTRYLEVSLMAEQQNNNTPPETGLSEQDRAALAQIRELQAQGFTVEGVVEQRNTLRQQARDLEIQSVVAAMEGRATREDVTAIQGHRHYPAVIAAVEQALRAEGNEAFAASVSQTGHSPLDALVLSIVNALPAEARMTVGEPPRAQPRMQAGQETETPQRTHRTEPIAADAQITDEMLEQFERSLGMGPLSEPGETEE